MRKICALFCSFGVLTSVSNRYSKSCEKCSQNLISYERAYREGNSFVGFISRLSLGIFKMCAGVFGFLSSGDFVNWVNLNENEDKEKTLKNWWKLGSALVGADGFRDVMDALNLSDERADFELLKEVYDKNYQGKSNVILEDLKGSSFAVSYNSIILLEALIEFVAYWNAYSNKVAQKIWSILSSKSNSLGLDKETMTLNEILKVLEPGNVKEIVNDVAKILEKVGSNIDCVMKLKNDYLKDGLTFEDASSKFVGIKNNQQYLKEELEGKLEKFKL